MQKLKCNDVEMIQNYECVENQQDANYILYKYNNIEIVEIPVQNKSYAFIVSRTS